MVWPLSSKKEDDKAVADKKDNTAVDTSVLKDMFGDDDEMFREILTDFVAPSEEIVEEIKKAFSNQSSEGIKQAAHKLKSAARSIGANSLADLCAELETAGKEDDLARSGKAMPELEPLFQAVKAYIENL